MGLFSRRSRDETPADGADAPVTDERADAPTAAGDGAQATGGAGGDDPDGASRGPYDVADQPELGARLDLGALRVPARSGLQVRLEMEKKSRNVVAVTLGLEGSAMQLQVFAAPRTAGIWDELREEISASVAKQGGTSEQATGPFGTELVTRLPVKTPEGGVGHRPARFLGVDGPRWFLRAVLTGRAAVEPDAAATFEALLADVVVVRGAEARAPRDVLLLHAPGRGAAPPAPVPTDAPLDPLRRGPEITEVR